MLRINHNKAQAVVELAVFGAVLIYLLGTIIRSAVGNSLTQNQNLKAMRMALLSSWEGSLEGNTSRNSASVLIVEDRLSPDINKYGDLDRTPYVASGGGSFTYQLLYPLTPGLDNMRANMSVMDVYINGQYFPLVTAEYNTETLPSPGDPAFPYCQSNLPPSDVYPLSQGQCLQNQCLRNQREWVGGKVFEYMFEDVVPANTGETEPLRTKDAQSHASDIFLALAGTNPNVTPAVFNPTTMSLLAAPNEMNSYGYVSTTFTGALSPSFISWYKPPQFPSPVSCNTQCQLAKILNILNGNRVQYKLFYTMVANPGVPGTNQTTPNFSPVPPVCIVHPCINQELSSDVPLPLAMPLPLTNPGNATTGTSTAGTDGEFTTNANGVMEYDLLRNANYTQVLKDFPTVPDTTCSTLTDNSTYLRCDIAWQWAATAGTTAQMIGLNTSNNQFPTYDIDGRLKEQTVYAIIYNFITGEPTVSFADNQLGDIDPTWDANSCGPKPGLQNDQEIFTFTQPGTYLQIKEGQLFNPESGQVVRSVNKRDTVDLVQRMVQLSNNTGRFCPIRSNPPNPAVDTVPLTYIDNDPFDYPQATAPNPVEVCVDGTGCPPPGSNTPGGPHCSCFSTEYNIKSTCFDETTNMLYVRSRLQDLRGNFWITNTSGQLKVQQ